MHRSGAHRTVAVLVLALLPGCGRVGFEVAGAAADSGAREAAADGRALDASSDGAQDAAADGMTDTGPIVALSPDARVITGSFVGDGTGGRSIVVGFRPDVVLVKGDATLPAMVRTATMPSNASKEIALPTALVPDAIVEFTADGFVLGSAPQVNSVAIVYYWGAFRMVPGDSELGSYSGDDVASREIALGLPPDYVMLIPANEARATQRFAPMGGVTSCHFHSANCNASSIVALTPDGFDIARDPLANASGTEYHFVAWRALAGVVSVGSYLGDATDGRTIVTGVVSEAVLLRNDAIQSTVWRPASIGAGLDSSQYLIADLGNLPDLIQALLAVPEPGFEVGASATVNRNGREHFYVAFARE